MTPRKGKLCHPKNRQSPSHKKRAEMRQLRKITKLMPADCLSDNNKHQTSDFLPFQGFDVPPLKRGIRILSLFDGISTVLHVIDTLRVHVEVYYSSEIDIKALSLQRHRFGDRITRLGSVTELNDDVLQSLGRIDLLIGGSPCSDLSLVNPRRRGLNDPTSTGMLFYEYCRIKTFLAKIAHAKSDRFLWLFENTRHMEVADRQEMSRKLGCDPVLKDACHHLPVKRKRLFWGNLPNMYLPSIGVTLPPPKLDDLLQSSRIANVQVIPTLTTSSTSQKHGAGKQCLPVTENGKPSCLYITEIESLFGFPPSYTDGPNLSLTDRRRLLGKAFCVPVLHELLSFLKDDFWVLPGKQTCGD